eukprot:scaffold19.g1765.t1
MAPKPGADGKEAQEYDPATRIFFVPHTVTFLLLGLAALVYYSHAFSPEPRPSDPAAAQALAYQNAKAGVWALVLSYLVYSTVQGPSAPMIRPHPAVWRLVHGIVVCYLLFMVFLLFQTLDDARQFLRHLYPELGLELPERAYGTECRLWIPGQGIDWKTIRETVWDEFTLAHTLGWWGKALIMRDYTLLWTTSVAFELCELTFQVRFGMWTVRQFKSKQYNWRGISQQPTLLAKARRGLLQFTPASWDARDWEAFSSPRRCLQCVFPVLIILIFEVNHFFLKALLWVPPTNPLNTYRLSILFLLALPGIKEYYEFIEADQWGPYDVFNKLGTYAWLGCALAVVESLVCVKFGVGLFPQPWPRRVLVAWGVGGAAAAAVLTTWTARYYARQRQARAGAQSRRSARLKQQ